MSRTAIRQTIPVLATLAILFAIAGDPISAQDRTNVVTPTPNITVSPTQPTGGTVKRPMGSQLKPGCNYNTSCKLNCEWCSGGTCICRLKGL
jgi:hypothetical protein